MHTKILRRPTRAAVTRALRDLEILWRPPDQEKQNGPNPLEKTAREKNKTLVNTDQNNPSGVNTQARGLR